MILGGTSTSNKSWGLLELAPGVASGSDWGGRRCTKAFVLSINFELYTRAIAQRLNALCAVRRYFTFCVSNHFKAAGCFCHAVRNVSAKHIASSLLPGA